MTPASRTRLAAGIAAACLAHGARAAVTIGVAPATLPQIAIDVPYAAQLTASGGRAPYAFLVTAGRLPPALDFSLDGLLSGTPAAALPYAFNVAALDADGRTTVATFSGAVDPGIPIGVPQTLGVREDASLPIQLAATDSNSAVLTFAIADPPQHGALSGTPPSVLYTPAPDYFGPDVFLFTASDGTLTGEPTLIAINVIPVNDVPQFAGGGDVVALRNGGAAVLPGWATVTSLGAPNESTQTPQFVITGNTRPGLFAVAPSIAPDGTLTFTPDGTAGVAALTFELRDNGGVFNGGVDRTAPQFFTIALQSPGTDLSVQIDATPAFTDNAPLQFVVRVANAGPSDAVDASVDVQLPPQLTAVQWTCVPVAPATCTASGSGDIADTVSMPANGSLAYTVQATVVTNGASQFAVEAQVAPGADQVDPDPADDSDQHVFSVDAIFEDGFED